MGTRTDTTTNEDGKRPTEGGKCGAHMTAVGDADEDGVQGDGGE